MKLRDNVDYSTRDYEGFRADMIDLLLKNIPGYTDVSSSDFGITLIELLAHGLDILSYYNDKVANEVFLDTAKEKENVRMLAKRMGYIAKDSTPSRFMQVFEIEPQEEDFVIPRGYVVKATNDKIEPQVIFELEDELVIPAHCTGLETDSEGEYLYQVEISQGESINDEVVGVSTQASNMKFYLEHSPVIKDSIVLNVTNNGSTEEWTRVDTFLNSSSTDAHYTLDIDGSDRGIITFGNGKSGKIPPINSEITASYKIGGGTSGNVSPYTITELSQTLAGIVRTFNPYSAFELAVDGDTIEEIRLKAPAEFRATWGAVTLSDYADIIRTEPDILDACSYQGEHPLDVKVYILPTDYAEMDDNSLRELRDRVIDIYNRKKAIGVDIYLYFAKVKKVDVYLDIHLHSNYAKLPIKELAETLITSSYSLGGKKFKEDLHISQVITELMEIQGVNFISGNFVDGDETCDTVTVDEGEVIAIDNIYLNMIGGV